MKMNKNNYFFRRENHINLFFMKIFLGKSILKLYYLGSGSGNSVEPQR